MANEAHVESLVEAPAPMRSGQALRISLASGSWLIPLNRLHHLAGYATLTGEPADYFLGWLSMRGEQVPVFDLNLVVCEQPTPQNYGSRVLIFKAGAESATPYIGVLAGGVTDTVSASESTLEEFELDSYLPMLYTLIPWVAEDGGAP
jgi:chemotaxis signal transduction protein